MQWKVIKYFLGYQPNSDLRYGNANAGQVSCPQRRRSPCKPAEGRAAPGPYAWREPAAAFTEHLCQTKKQRR